MNTNNDSSFFYNIHTTALLALIAAAIGVTGYLYTQITNTNTANLLNNITAVHSSQLAAASSNGLDTSRFPDAIDSFTASDNGITLEDDFIYSVGYYRSTDGQWSQFSFSGNTQVGSWYNAQAQANLNPSDVDYVLAYSCSRINNGWNCHNGWQLKDLTDTNNQPSGNTTITIRAKGDHGSERMQLQQNGDPVQTWTVDTNYDTYTYNTNDSVTASDLRVAFTNDAGTTRDLVVDYLQLNDQRLEAEDQNTNTGVYQDGSCGGSYSQQLQCGGYIAFGTEDGGGEDGGDEQDGGGESISLPGPEFTADKIRRFDGTGSGFTSDRTLSFGEEEGFTFSAWVKRAGACQSSRSKIIEVKNNNNNTAIMLTCPTDNRMQWWVRNRSGALASAEETGVIPTDRWVHYVGVRDGNTVTLFRDGQRAARDTADFSAGWSDASMRLGHSIDGGARKFDGLIGDVQIYDNTLTSQQVNALYEQGPPSGEITDGSDDGSDEGSDDDGEEDMSGVRSDDIQPYTGNRWYWQYEGDPVMLLGGSGSDDIFLSYSGSRMNNELNTLVNAGGNYVRNVMPADGEPYPFEKVNGEYDLDQWNDAYWNRLKSFLDAAEENDVIAQVTFWDGFYIIEDNWDRHPYNPKNNGNYNYSNTDLPRDWDAHPAQKDHPLYKTTPDLNDDREVLGYQEAYIEKLLSITTDYNNVLYNIQNEAATPLSWSHYWAEFAQNYAQENNEKIFLTSMRDHWDITKRDHREVINRTDIYDYVDVSQNTWMIRRHGNRAAQRGYNHLQTVRSRIKDSGIRPMNVVKLYGADGADNGINTEQATHTFWVHLFGGVASARFHRPDYGLGLGNTARTHISSARRLHNEIDFISVEPHNNLLSNRERDEAYAVADPGDKYAVYFRDGGSVRLNTEDVNGSVSVKWLDVNDSQWYNRSQRNPGSSINLSPNRSGKQVVVITAN